MVAFAANSVLCRMALGKLSIDAASFTSIRLVSGSLTLLLLLRIRYRNTSSRGPMSKGSWISGFMLFLYAACFSYAYISLDAGIGALIAFGTVQITMIGYGFTKGRRLNRAEWLGLLVAFGGFVYLVSPGITAPPLQGFILMTLSGFGWGMYSALGIGSSNPLEDTTFNFLRSNAFIPVFILLVAGLGLLSINLTNRGILLAVISGAITSGLGYTIWYMALRGLTNVQASVVQLSVPILAALGGIIFLAEKLSFRLVMSSLIILGGIFLVIIGKSKNRLKI